MNSPDYSVLDYSINKWKIFTSHINNTKIMLFRYDEDINNHIHINRETLEVCIFLLEVKEETEVEQDESDEMCKMR